MISISRSSSSLMWRARCYTSSFMAWSSRDATIWPPKSRFSSGSRRVRDASICCSSAALAVTELVALAAQLLGADVEDAELAVDLGQLGPLGERRPGDDGSGRSRCRDPAPRAAGPGAGPVAPAPPPGSWVRRAVVIAACHVRAVGVDGRHIAPPHCAGDRDPCRPRPADGRRSGTVGARVPASASGWRRAARSAPTRASSATAIGLVPAEPPGLGALARRGGGVAVGCEEEVPQVQVGVPWAASCTSTWMRRGPSGRMGERQAGLLLRTRAGPHPTVPRPGRGVRRAATTDAGACACATRSPDAPPPRPTP